MPATSVRGGTIIPALTNAIAATIADSPITALSLTTAFMPTSAFALDDAAVQHRAVADVAVLLDDVSVPGNPCMTQRVLDVGAGADSMRPKSPRSDAAGPM